MVVDECMIDNEKKFFNYETGSNIKRNQTIEVQRLILEVSALLDDFELEGSDSKLTQALEQICRYGKYDRVHLGLISEDQAKMTHSKEWFMTGIHSIALDIVNSKKFSIAGLVRELKNNERYLLLSDINESSDFSWIDKNLLVNQNIQYFLFLPIKHENQLIGFLDFYLVNRSKELTEEELITLETISQLFSQAIVHKKIVSGLKQSEGFYRNIFNNAGAAKVIIENDYISLLNRECESIFGYTMEEMVGTRWVDYFSNDMVENLTKYYHIIGFDTHPSTATFKYITKLKTKAGKNKTALVSVNLISNTKKIAVTILDLSEFYQVKHALEAISACNMAMIHATTEKELIDNVCSKIVDVGGYRFAWVAYIRDDENKSMYPAARAGYEDGYLCDLQILLEDPILGNGPFGKAVKTSKITICRNTMEDESFIPWRENALKQGYKSLIAFPLYIPGKEPFGVLGIYSDQVDIFDDEEVKVLSEMASDLTYGIISLRTRVERDHMTEKLEMNLDKMNQILYQTVTSLSNVVEMRDPYTAGHQRKVAELATALARELELSEDEIQGIYYAATLHDIGKVNIPSEILSKPGKLNTLEFEIIKTHSQAGYNIIKDIDYPWPIAKIILQHHEKMDGSGYPNGLKGDEILMGARIISVADVVEAMSSHRPYRPSVGLSRAFDEITLNKGTKFDEKVVDACLNLFQNKGFEFE